MIYVPTHDNVAGIFTNALPFENFEMDFASCLTCILLVIDGTFILCTLITLLPERVCTHLFYKIDTLMEESSLAIFVLSKSPCDHGVL